MQEGLPIAESLEDAMTDTIRCREKHQESYHLGTAALLWVCVSVCVATCMSVHVTYVFLQGFCRYGCVHVLGVGVCFSM